jgi:hypothetical protein
MTKLKTLINGSGVSHIRGISNQPYLRKVLLYYICSFISGSIINHNDFALGKIQKKVIQQVRYVAGAVIGHDQACERVLGHVPFSFSANDLSCIFREEGMQSGF